MRRQRLLILALLLPLATPLAAAHATIEEARPPAGARLDASPTELALTFSEPVEAAETRLEVHDVNGTRVDDPATLQVDANGARVRFRTNLTEGSYITRWSALSTVDGHRSNGAWAFAVGAAALPIATTTDVPPYPWLTAVAKYAIYVGLALLAGFVAFESWFGAHLPDPHPGAARRIALLGASLLLGGLLLFLLSEAHLNEKGLLDYALATSFGRGLLLRLPIAALLLASLRWDRRLPPTTAKLTRGALLAAALFGHGYYSHAAALGPERTAGALLDALHLAAAFAWSGGLVYLFLTLRALGPDATDLLATLGGRFSRLAQSAIVLLLLTGLGLLATLLGTDVATWPAELRETYGILLAYKIFLAFLMMAIGAANHFFFVAKYVRKERVDTVPLFRANVRREAINGILILAMAALLTNLSPSVVA